MSTDRVLPDRSGRSGQTFPPHPVIEWQARIAEGIALGILVDGRGALIAPSPTGTVTAIDRTGRNLWVAELGSAPLAAGSLTNGARAVFVSRAGLVTSFDGAGRERYRLFLGQTGRPSSAASLPHPSGGVVLNLDTDLFWIDDDGEVAAQTSVNRTPTALLLDAHDDALVITDDGSVFRWDFWRSADRLGTLGGRASSAVIGHGRLYAILTNGRLVSFDLARRTLRSLPSSMALKGATLTLLPNAELRVLGRSGILRGYDAEGTERESQSLDSQGIATIRATGFELAFIPPIVDAAGNFAFAASGVPATVLLADGNFSEAATAACDTPVTLAPAGPSRLVLACASGMIWSLSQAPVKP